MATVTESLGNLSAYVDVGLGSPSGPVYPDSPWSASGSASDIVWYISSGPKRPGFIALNSGAFGGFAYANVGGLSGVGTFPFELGVPFEATVSALTWLAPLHPEAKVLPI